MPAKKIGEPPEESKDGKGRLIMIVVALIAFAGTIGAAVINKGCPSRDKGITYQGSVRDKNNLPVKDAKVSILSNPEIASLPTGDDGKFYFKIKKTVDSPQIKVQVLHDNFKEWNELRTLNSDPFTDNITLEPKAGTNGPAKAQVSGTVRDASGTPIAGVEVFVIGGVERTESTNNGTFILEIQRGKETVHLQTRKSGYRAWNGWVAVPTDSYVITISRR